jgi:hypothetical protein
MHSIIPSFEQLGFVDRRPFHHHPENPGRKFAFNRAGRRDLNNRLEIALIDVEMRRRMLIPIIDQNRYPVKA